MDLGVGHHIKALNSAKAKSVIPNAVIVYILILYYKII